MPEKPIVQMWRMLGILPPAVTVNTERRVPAESGCAPVTGSEKGAPLCPKCGGPLTKVEQSPRSLLNREQWLAARAGDYYCACHDNDRGRQGLAYYWSNEVGDSPSDSSSAMAAGRNGGS
jgi:hypothetical protein